MATFFTLLRVPWGLGHIPLYFQGQEEKNRPSLPGSHEPGNTHPFYIYSLKPPWFLCGISDWEKDERRGIPGRKVGGTDIGVTANIGLVFGEPYFSHVPILELSAPHPLYQKSDSHP